MADARTFLPQGPTFGGKGFRRRAFLARQYYVETTSIEEGVKLVASRTTRYAPILDLRARLVCPRARRAHSVIHFGTA